jgi:hypothetical protein
MLKFSNVRLGFSENGVDRIRHPYQANLLKITQQLIYVTRNLKNTFEQESGIKMANQWQNNNLENYMVLKIPSYIICEFIIPLHCKL